ncbi:MAG: CRTAC1 family protein [Candidatus Latescibacterota bacterium]|nr:CRTAC1 family protein [Candidatus Latescibacterota bacterium]
MRDAGIHSLREGSQQAAMHYAAALRENPDDLAARWLLNLAQMTLGQYPDQVPASQLIPPEVFLSDYDIKRFRDVAPQLGLDVVARSGGSIVEDFDGDGHLDIVASSWGLLDQLRYFRSNGDGSFQDLTAAAGLLGQVGGLNLCHADYDNDGHRDILVLRGAWLGRYGHHPNSLLRNMGNGTFADVTEISGLLSFHPTHSAAWGDYDNDGLLDLYVGNESDGWERHPCQLYHNNGDGTFTDVAADLGVDNVGFVKGVTWGDYDNDGLLDLYLSRLEQPNVLYHNQGHQQQWRFADVSAAAGVSEPIGSFPTWFWDYDNDGLLDLFVAGYYNESIGDIPATYLDLPNPADRPRLYRNMGNGTFADVAAATGLADIILAMGANFGDLDNDGFLDCYVGTGNPDLRSLLPNRMLRNDRGRAFQDVTTAGGFGHIQKGHGISFADLDHDGDQDIYVVMGGAYSGDVYQNILFENPGHGNHWLTLQLAGTASNRDAIGARIRIRVVENGMPRDIYATVGTGGSFGSSSLQQEIGLGRAEVAAEIAITWPATGQIQTFTDIAADQVLQIREGDDRPVPVDRHPFSFSNSRDGHQH